MLKIKTNIPKNGILNKIQNIKNKIEVADTPNICFLIVLVFGNFNICVRLYLKLVFVLSY